MSHVKTLSKKQILAPAKADSLTGKNDVIDTLHNFADMLGAFKEVLSSYSK